MPDENPASNPADSNASPQAAASPAASPVKPEFTPRTADEIERQVSDKLQKIGVSDKSQLSNGGREGGGGSGNSTITIDTGRSSRRTSVNSHHSDGLSDAVPIVAIVFVFLYLIVRAVMAPFCRKTNKRGEAIITGGFSPDEVALMHKMQNTLGQMERRVEALETILIERRSSGASSIAASRRPVHSQNSDPAATHDL